MCERHSSSVCLWVCVRTHVSEVEEGRFSQIVFQFLSTPPPSVTLPSPLPLLPSLLGSVCLIHSSPFLSSPLSLSEVNAGSLQCSERVQHQEYVRDYWLTDGDLTNRKKGTAVMGPLHQ